MSTEPADLIDVITTQVGTLGLPAVARDGSCIAVSDHICSTLQAKGLDAQVRLITGMVNFMGTDVVGWLHYAVLVEDLVVDATATQFDPTLPALIVSPLDGYVELLSEATGATVTVQGHD